MSRLASPLHSKTIRPLLDCKRKLPLPTLIANKIRTKGFALNEHRVLAIDHWLKIKDRPTRVVFLPHARRSHIHDAYARHFDFFGNRRVPGRP